LVGPGTSIDQTFMMRYSYNYRPERYQYTYGRAEEEEPVEPVSNQSGWREPQEDERGESPGVGGHGLSGYRWRKCRCPVCYAAKARSAREYRRRKAQRQG
jgi:hypothetical protein